ncbi:nucleotidyltransferase family protein [Micropruina sonneratiae]|uniref:nucleotidyltransferase family protein n=1 Tax=Micropruina sonneratiae TaxID=2986940 RepID=UPI002227D458|nr:nucleotidyltransferase family protein [Micropruina sp. KQZ13P-5]MCW3158818.1 nucleotidyltransferase family protein [Micropruina sp. KQZ13P-5]
MSGAAPLAGIEDEPLGPVIGVVLAAGRGSRSGGPKVLRRDDEGTPWVANVVHLLREGGCAEVIVVLGAEAGQARALMPAGVVATYAPDWQLGLAESLRAGLASAEAMMTAPPVAVAITLVDIAGGNPETLRRLLAHLAPDCLVRAGFDGRPGHPVLIGHEHWRPLARSLGGDQGAAGYLRDHGVLLVECGDLESGEDVDD